ncbi:MAG: Ig-like domain-containing protein, partial [Bacteroidota bacterium]
MNYVTLKSAITLTFIATSLAAITSNQALAGEESKRGITVTIEAPDIHSTQLSTPSEYYVIDFETESGTNSLIKTNGSTSYTYSGDLEVKEADEWGGASLSKYITQNYTEATGFMQSFKVDITEDQKYFGFWWSAGDPYNEITFKNDGEIVASFRTEDLVSFIENSDAVNTSEYLGNPNSIYDTLESAHKTQPFSFVNVFFNDDSAFDEIVITSDQNDAAFESDNHTFSAVKQPIRGTVVPNTAPVANDDTATVGIYNSVTIDVLANDTDPEGDATSISSIDSVFGGEAIIEDNKIIYTADSMPGEFSLTYTVQDVYGKTDSGTVIITV